MRKLTRLTAVFFCLLLAGFFLSHSQQRPLSYSALLQFYNEAQQQYDAATRLSSRKNYGPAEEEEEAKLNKLALQKFSLLYPQIQKSTEFDSLRFYTAYKIGELQHYFENFSQAVRFYTEAIDANNRRQLPDSVLFKPYVYSGIIYYNQNKFDSAIRFFKTAEVIQRNAKRTLSESERLYNLFGVLYYERGNYRQAENYFQKAIEVLRPENEAYQTLYVNYHINLAQIYLKLEEYDKANNIYQKLLPLNILKNDIYHNIGSLNLSLGAAEKALVYFRKVSPDYNKIVRLYNNVGNAYFIDKQFDSANAYYKKAITAYHSLSASSDPVGYGLALKSLGVYKMHLQQYDSALFYYQKALHQFYPSFATDDIRKNPQQYSGVFSYINLFNSLLAKAEAWHELYKQTTNLSAAQQELLTYQSAFKLIEYVERTYESDEARLFLAKIKYTVHNKPIEIAYTLYQKTGDRNYLDALYVLDQQNKATALALSRQINTELRGVHSPLLQKEQELKTAITRLSIRAAQLTDSAQLVSLNQNIRDNEIQLSKVQDQLNQQSTIKETNIPPIAQLQKEVLGKTTAVLSYHLSDDKLTLLFISPNDVFCVQHLLPQNFPEKISSYISNIKNISGKTIGGNDELYDLFFSGVPLQNVEQLIIIPDDVLSYLPFEALQNTEGRYLVEKIAVQYQYSSALLSKEQSDLSGSDILSFAPFSATVSPASFPPLSNSKDEISGLPGRKFFNADATKSEFLQDCGAYKVIHLATHAVVNGTTEDLSYIAFSPSEKDNLLYAKEIYNLPLQHTELIVLSACETNAGQLVKGEGIMSLSRAFRYAGCANVLTTLWTANDFSTAYLTKRVHQYLKKDYSIARAVQQAKRDYLTDKTINPRLKLPYYWSHLVFIGDVQEERSGPWLIMSTGIVIFLASIFLLRKKSRKAGP